MRTLAWMAAALLLSGPAMAPAQPPKSSGKPVQKAKLVPEPLATGRVVAQAHADIVGRSIAGSVDFTEHSEGTATVVVLHLTVGGLTPGLHGMHLHAVGKCDLNFAAAGGHFDPGPAGNTDPDANHPFHLGDLPQLEVGANGRAALDVVTTRVTLSDGPLSVFDADGTAIVIHANPDQGVTGAERSGVSGGPRVACGVIQRK